MTKTQKIRNERAARSHLWKDKTTQEVAAMEGISEALARQLMYQFGIQPASPVARRLAYRKERWEGKTIQEIMKMEPDLGKQGIYAYAKYHNIEIGLNYNSLEQEIGLEF